MEYLTESGKRYHFSYTELKDEYKRLSGLSDNKFFTNLSKLLHFTIFVSYLKEIPADCLLSDDGIIHELVHLLNKETRDDVNKKRLRENWNKILKLS